MLKKIVPLFLVLALTFSLNGCAKHLGESNSTSETLARIEQLPISFLIVYGETGQLFHFSPEQKEMANYMYPILLEPGFLLFISIENKEKGFDSILAEIFKREGFRVQEARESKRINGTYEMIFVYMTNKIFLND